MRQADTAAAGRQPDVPLLRAIAGYLSTYPSSHHHPCEEVIYGHLICHLPGAAKDMFTLIEDHRSLAERTAAFRRAVDGLETWTESARKAFAQEARRFVDEQTRHLDAEERDLFPEAETHLTAAQWAEVDRWRCEVENGSLPPELAAFDPSRATPLPPPSGPIRGD